ncbi:MAG: hypothetical protein ABSF26_17495, partial [Thermoguttaceae bacterium]
IAFGFVPIRELQEREDGQYRKAWRKASAVRFAGILLVPSGAGKNTWIAFSRRTPWKDRASKRGRRDTV